MMSLCVAFVIMYYQVLDEADQLLDSGFSKALQSVFRVLSADRQTLLFGTKITATMKRLTELSKMDCFTWEASARYVTFVCSIFFFQI